MQCILFPPRGHRPRIALGSRPLFQWLAALCLALAAGAAQACGPYTVVFYEFGRLFYTDAAGQPAGVDKELIDELARRSGCTLNRSVDSRPRIWQQLAAGQLDITVSGVETPERLQQAEFIPYLQSHNLVLMRKELVRQLPSAAAFLAEPQRSAVVVKRFSHGVHFDAWLDELRRQRRLHEVGDFDTALRVFRAGRADLMLSHAFNLPAQADWLADYQMLDWMPGDRVHASLVLSRSRVSAADRAHLRQGLQSMLADGSVDAILQRQLGAAAARSVRLGGPAATR